MGAIASHSGSDDALYCGNQLLPGDLDFPNFQKRLGILKQIPDLQTEVDQILLRYWWGYPQH